MLSNYDIQDGIATITLNNGKANVFSSDMIASIHKDLDQAEADKAIVIFRGNAKIFSGGFDLSEITKDETHAKNLVKKGSELSLRLLSFARPVIAAAEGHAIAKGAFILLSCDFRIGAEEGTKTGLNETQIGMTMHHFGIELARERLAKTHFMRSMVIAEILGPDDARQAGYYDVLAPKDKVYETAQMIAQQFKGLSPIAFTNNKRKSRKALYEKLEWAIGVDFSQSILDKS